MVDTTPVPTDTVCTTVDTMVDTTDMHTIEKFSKIYKKTPYFTGSKCDDIF